VRDARIADGEHLHRMGVVAAVAADQLAREAGLTVGGDGDQLEVAGLAENSGAEEPRDPAAPGEPGEHRRHLECGVLSQQPREGGRVGILEGSRVPVEQRAGGWLRETMRSRFSAGRSRAGRAVRPYADGTGSSNAVSLLSARIVPLRTLYGL
jgi:hypothetical protein